MLFALLLAAQSPSAAREPFWKAKEKYYERISEKHEIIVSVRTEKNASGGQTLLMDGGGHMYAPAKFCLDQALHFENLKEAIDEIKEVREEAGRVFLRAKAYGYEAKMWLTIRATSAEMIRFEVVEGTLKGLRGEMQFTSLNSKKTEIGLHGSYDYVKFPIPQFFAKFGIEVILKRMAFRLRSFLEKRFNDKKVDQKARVA